MHYIVVIPENTDIATAFSKIPVKATKLYLCSLNLGGRNIDDLIKAFALIPKTVTDLVIRYNQFEKLSDEQFAQVLGSIGNHVESLHIEYKDFIKLVNLVVKAPVNPLHGCLTTLKTLKLQGSGYELQYFRDEKAKQLTECFQCVPQTVVNFELNYVGLGFTDHVTSDEPERLALKSRELFLLVQCFSYLSKNITSLGMSDNNISRLPVDTLRALFATIPQIKTLDLTLNEFATLPSETTQLQELFLIPPVNVQTLIIGMQSERHETRSFSQLCKNLPASVTTLDIGNYFLARITHLELRQVFLSVPITVECLRLRHSNVFQGIPLLSSVVLALSTIPEGVSTLDLSENYYFENLTTKEFIFVLSKISRHIRNVIFSFNDFKNRSKEDLIALATAMPNVIGLELFDSDRAIDPDYNDEDEAIEAINASCTEDHSVELSVVLETLRKYIGRTGKEQYVTAILTLHFMQPHIPADLIRIIFDYNYYYPPLYKFKPVIPVASMWSFFCCAPNVKTLSTVTIEHEESSSKDHYSKK